MFCPGCKARRRQGKKAQAGQGRAGPWLCAQPYWIRKGPCTRPYSASVRQSMETATCDWITKVQGNNMLEPPCWGDDVCSRKQTQKKKRKVSCMVDPGSPTARFAGLGAVNKALGGARGCSVQDARHCEHTVSGDPSLGSTP